MDNRLKEIAENLETYKIGLDDSFSFKCRSCGKCCKNREDIMFTTRDIFRIAKHLGRTSVDIIKSYCDWYIGNDSRVPIVRLKPHGPANACPFLVQKHCSIHEVKPVVCALFPIGRTYMASEKPDKGEEPTYVPGYIFQPTDCGAGRKTHTVRQWLEKFNIPVDDEFYIEWNKMIVFVSKNIKALEEQFSQKSLVPLQDTLFELIYVQYDTDGDMLTQFGENMAKVKIMFETIQSGLQEFLQQSGGDTVGEQ